MTATVADVVAALEARYDPRYAEDWDAVGLVTGDRDAPVEVVSLAVDPTEETLTEALDRRATMLVTHHPLLLRGVHAIDTTTYKGRLLARLVRENVALYVAHTNADVAPGGVSDALADALGLSDVEPLVPTAPREALKLVVFTPHDATQDVLDALAAAGAGRIGEYERCAFWVDGIGTYVAGEGTNPTVGEAGQRTETKEQRLETVLPPERLPEALAALRRSHPYEEPAYDVVPTLVPSRHGLGRVGTLARPLAADGVARWLADALPTAPIGVRVTGLTGEVRRVAVCGGAGDDAIPDAVRAGADLYVTADLRHHVTREATESGLALADVGHWASEAPWVRAAATQLARDLDERGHSVQCHASTLVTDPWQHQHSGGPTA